MNKSIFLAVLVIAALAISAAGLQVTGRNYPDDGSAEKDEALEELEEENRDRELEQEDDDEENYTDYEDEQIDSDGYEDTESDDDEDDESEAEEDNEDTDEEETPDYEESADDYVETEEEDERTDDDSVITGQDLDAESADEDYEDSDDSNMCTLDAEIFVKESSSTENEYVFVCVEHEGFVPEAYVWDFGDGRTQAGENEVFHRYDDEGTYHVRCAATDAENAAFGHRIIDAGADTPTEADEDFDERADGYETDAEDLEQDDGQSSEDTTEGNDDYTTEESNDDSNIEEGDYEFFDSDLRGEEEVPPVETPAGGESTASLTERMLSVTGRFEGLESDLIEVEGSSAHIHDGRPGEAGPVVFNLNVFPEADNRSGTFGLSEELTDEQVDKLLNGDYYINVHSREHPMGEIRGQLAVQ